MSQKIRDALLFQKEELEKKLAEAFIQRETTIRDIGKDIIKVIIGPRRAGKSFFAMHSLKGRVFGYANFDEASLIECEDYNEIISTMEEIYNNPKILLLDEIQNLPKWELFVNGLQRRGFNLILTGSNANLLSQELATHLTGRHIDTYIFPFFFSEFLPKPELPSSEKKAALDRYLVYGGYPEPLKKELDYGEYLATLFESTIYKDIIKRHKIRTPKDIENLAYFLISNVAAPHTLNSLARASNLGVNTVKRFMSYLDESLIFFSLCSYSQKVKEQLKSPKKIYCIDNGFIHAKAFRSNPDFGKLYENCVAANLKKLSLSQRFEIFYWKNPQGEEVDFVIKKGTGITALVQVCFNIEDEQTREREMRALLKASRELRCSNLFIITADREGVEDFEWFGKKAKISLIPLWKWLLTG